MLKEGRRGWELPGAQSCTPPLDSISVSPCVSLALTAECSTCEDEGLGALGSQAVLRPDAAADRACETVSEAPPQAADAQPVWGPLAFSSPLSLSCSRARAHLLFCCEITPSSHFSV